MLCFSTCRNSRRPSKCEKLCPDTLLLQQEPPTTCWFPKKSGPSMQHWSGQSLSFKLLKGTAPPHCNSTTYLQKKVRTRYCTQEDRPRQQVRQNSDVVAVPQITQVAVSPLYKSGDARVPRTKPRKNHQHCRHGVYFIAVSSRRSNARRMQHNTRYITTPLDACACSLKPAYAVPCKRRAPTLATPRNKVFGEPKPLLLEPTLVLMGDVCALRERCS